MSRLQHGPGYSSPMLLGKTSAVDFAATGDHINLHRQTSTKEHPRRASTPTETMSEEKGGPSGSDTTNNADGNESDGAESDDADGNVGEPDVLAPSGTNIDIQTGLHRDSKDVGEIPDTKNRGGCPGLLNTKPPSRSPNAINQSSASKQNPVSSDDDYNGVDLISESAEDQPMMESIEEKAIIESEEEHVNLSRLLSPPDSSSDAFQFNLAVLRDTDYDAHAFVTDDPVFQDRLCLFDPDHCEDDDVDYHGFVNASRLGSPFTPTTRRRVRFADPPLVSPEADTRNTSNLGTARSPRTQLSGYAYDEDQPLFAEDVQSLLGGRATISREAIAHGSWHNDRSSSGEREFVKDGDDESSVGNSSGYETDQGETTDEEDVPASATTRPSALLRDSSMSSLNNRLAGQSLPNAPPRRFPLGVKRGPTMGSWVTDPTKPIAVVASSGKQLIVYPAQRPKSRGGKIFPTIASSGRSSALASPRPTPAKLAVPSHHTATEESEVERSEKSSQETATPMLSASPNLMMPGLGLGRANLVSGHALGPPEAFFPLGSTGTDGEMIGDELDMDDDDEEDAGESLLKIEDFINFNEDSEDSEHDLENPAQDTLPDRVQSKPTLTSSSPSPTTSTNSLLDHLDRGVVTAFRRNQYGRGANGFLPSSASSFHAAAAMKGNPFVPSNAASMSNKKRKLGGSNAPPALPRNALAKRRVLDR